MQRQPGIRSPFPITPTKASVPESANPPLHLLQRIGQVDPAIIDDYTKLGGYQALRKAIEMGPEAIVREVIESKLLGRGGAAFPTGKKWGSAAAATWCWGWTHYVICNADESEPGTFKDRIVMEAIPSPFWKALPSPLSLWAQRKVTSTFAANIRWRMEIQNAIKAARAKGFVGKSVCGSKYKFDIELRRGAGAYICGKKPRCSIPSKVTAASRAINPLSPRNLDFSVSELW